MTNDAILNVREAIRKEFKAYDNSFKVKKPTLCSILQSIEDSSISFNYNMAMLIARKKSSSLTNYLSSVRYAISEELECYKATYSTVYKVDDTFKDWWFNQPHKKDMELHYTWFKEKEPVLLEYSGVVYLFKRDTTNFILRVLSDYESISFLN